MIVKKSKLLIFVFIPFFINCSDSNFEAGESLESVLQPSPPENFTQPEEPSEEEIPVCMQTLYFDQLQPIQMNATCTKANQSQLDQVNLGNLKKDQFLSRCYSENNYSCWCDQLVRPNPDSFLTFQCTYGNQQSHQLIHPDESTWGFAFEAVKIIEELEKKNILTKIIYNWWRPEPYNNNVSGAPGRHDLGTSVDVRFQTKEMQNLAFTELCQLRKQGRVRAVGYYASSALHFGVGDNNANTWGKSCP